MTTSDKRQEFLERRRTGIGGSDVAAIFGLSRWKTAYDVWAEKTSTEPVEEVRNDVLELASYLEDFTAQKYADVTGHKVQRKNTEIVNKDYAFIKGNIDREILLDERGLGILECKALSNYAFRRVELYGLPDEYLFQIQHYFLCANGRYSWAAFAIINRDNGKLLHFEVKSDADIQAQIKDKCIEFWNYVTTKTPPPTSETASAEQPKEQYNGILDDLTEDTELNNLIAEYNEDSAIATEANALLDDVKARIATHLADHEAVECKGAKIYYKSSTRTTFDTVKFKKEQAELYNKYTKTSEAKKTLRIYTTTQN